MPSTVINPNYVQPAPPIRITSNGIQPGVASQSGGRPIYNASGLISGYTPVGPTYNPLTNPNPINTQYQPGPAAPKIIGQPQTTATTTNDPNSQFSLLKQAKNPQLSDLTAKTAANVGSIEDTTTKTFRDYLAEAKQQQANTAGQIATDTANLNALPGETQTKLDAINKTYADNQSQINQQYQAANAADASRVQKNITDLGTLNQGYITNTMAGAKMAADIGEANVNRFNAASGTPNSVGSGYYGAAAQVAANALIPAEQQVSQMQIGQLTNFVAPQQQQLYSNELGQLNFQSAGAQQIAQMQAGSAQQVAALKQAVAGRSAQESMAFMQSLGIPLQVAQSVLSGSVSQLGALTSTDNANNFYGLSTNYQGTPIASPGYQTPNINPAYRGGGNVQPNIPAPVAPTINTGYGGQPTAAPVGAPGGINYVTGGTPQNPNGFQYGSDAYYAQVKASQMGLNYDPNLGVYVDQQGQVVTPGGGGNVNPQYQSQTTNNQWTDPNASWSVE